MIQSLFPTWYNHYLLHDALLLFDIISISYGIDFYFNDTLIYYDTIFLFPHIITIS